jgi:mannosyltransferase OCH1-like enzyme
VYDAYPLEIYRVDFIRAVYLFFYGGIYADIDVQCLKPLDRYLSISGVCLARMGEYDEFDNSIPNAIMASSKNCGFWLYYMQKMVRISNTADREKNVEWVTGPAVLRSSALDFNNNIEIAKVSIYNFVKEFNISIDFDNIDFSSVNIMNNEIWYPLDWTNEGHQQIRKQVLADEIFIDRNMAAKQFSNSEMVTYWASTWRPA